MKRLRLVWPTVCVTVALVGCGPTRASGQIVFPDGTPVKGLVNGGIEFRLLGDREHYSAVSFIDADARFDMHSVNPSDGLRPGTYQVLIYPPVTVAEQDSRRSDAYLKALPKWKPGMPPPQLPRELFGVPGMPPQPPIPIHPKYLLADSSDLRVVIDRSISDLRVTVDPPPPQRQKK
jgi:hypothetical protein